MSQNCCLLIGDPFLVEQRRNALVASIREKCGDNIAEQTSHLSDTPLAQVLAEARTLPFLVSAQIFYLREADRLNKDDAQTLKSYLENPTSNTYLILEASAIDKRHALVKLMEAAGSLYVMDDSQKRSMASRFLVEKLKSARKTITPPAQAYLESMVGDAPMFLGTILDQLVNYAGNEEKITEEMVHEFEEKWSQVDIFKFADALATGNMAKALKLLRDASEESGGDYPWLIGFLHWQLRRFWVAKVLLDEGVSQDAVLAKCRISKRQAPYFMRQLKPMSQVKLKRALEGLFQVDWKMKTGAVDAAAGLESWVVEWTG
ncbi:MAG: DNA polymerase III subunit delta [Candidatus Omnitrophota bacterium]|nr:DNA polymerase III subunit delta [Candidatus Omnitrophota bacterium]